MTNQSNLQADSNFDQFLINSFKLFKIIRDFDLDSILRSIALPFVFVFIVIQELNDILFTFEFELPEFYIPQAIVHPALLINNQLQSFTVKNLRKMQKFPKYYRKQDMIEALLITH